MNFKNNPKYKRMLLFVIVVVVIYMLFQVFSTTGNDPTPSPDALHQPIVPENKPTISLKSDPGSASIIFDDRPIAGVTPLDISDVAAGIHTAQISKTGYRTEIIKFKITNQDTSISVSLTKLQESPQKKATVSLKSNPDGASIIFDGRPIAGVTPLEISNVAAGIHIARISKTGYRTEIAKFEVANQDTLISVSLMKLQEPPRLSTLDIDSEPRNAKIVVNGKYVGQTPFRKDSVEMKSYNVRLSKEGFVAHDTTTSIREGKIQSLFVKLIAQPIVQPAVESPSGHLTVSVKPEIENNTGWIKVYSSTKTFVEDHFWGPALRNEPVPTGICSLAVEHPRFGLWRDRIEILGGKETHVNIDFQESIEIWVDAIHGNRSERADIFVDGNKLNTQTPAFIPLHIGLRKIRVAHDNFASTPADTIINLKNGPQENRITFRLRNP